MAVTPKHAPATLADLRALGEDSRWELIAGELVEKAAPRPEHSRRQVELVTVLGRRFLRKPGGRWPGGWWLMTEFHVAYGAEVFCHDVTGYRRENLPTVPNEWPMQQRPEWVCELLSPNHEKRDLVDKLKTLHHSAVPHYWIINPEEKTLVVHRWTSTGYVIVLTAAGAEVVRAEPFDAVELKLAVIFGDEDDED